MATVYTLADFRSVFPEFTNATVYPDASIQMWLDVAVNFVSEERWKSSYKLGIMLWTAHNVLVSKKNERAVRNGLAGSVVSGPLSFKSVDKVSGSYSNSAASIEGAGDYNLTPYGTRFKRLLRLFGAGALHI